MNKKWMVTIQTGQDAEKVRDSGAEILAEYPNALLVRTTEKQRVGIESAGLELSVVADETVQLTSATFAFASAVAAEAAQPVAVDPNRTAYFLVRLIGPPKGEWLETLKACGASIYGTLSGNVLLAGVLPTQLARLQEHPWVEQVTPYRPAMKVSPKLRPGVARTLTTAHLTSLEAGAPGASEQIEISVFPGESSEKVAALVRTAGGEVLGTNPTSVTAVVPSQEIAALAEQPGVLSIVPHRFPKLHNDRARTVMNVPANQTFGDFTLRGAGQIVGIADSGLDSGNPAAIHQDFTGRIAGIISFPNQLSMYCNDPAPYDDGPQDTNPHGTHVAGSVLGNGAAAIAASDPTVPMGVAPEAQVYFQAVEQQVNWKPTAPLILRQNPVGLFGIPDDLNDLFAPSYAAGVRIHTNSWGSPDNGQYATTSREVDQFMFNHRDMLILFSAGNEGLDSNNDGVIDPDSIGSPGTAKNCLTVGATENNRPHGSTPQPGIDANWNQLGHNTSGGFVLSWPQMGPAGHVSDNVSGMAAFSSRGPTDDGRIKPEVVAPGTNVLSVKSTAFPAGQTPLWGDLPAAHPLHDLYCWSGGTSMSTPLVAGAAALVRQHLTQQRGHNVSGSKPSGALIKAFLINGAVAINPGQFTAGPGTPPIPATNEIPAGPNFVDGFGRVNLADTLAPGLLKQTLFADEPDYAVESGQIRTFQVRPIDLGQPIKIALCWTDAPALAGAGGLVNQLYLRVLQPNGTLLAGDTTAYPTATNNVQQVVITAPAAGTYEIRVHGLSVSTHSPGVPAGPNPRQDFALVTSNAMGFSLQPVSIAQAIDTTGSMDYFDFMAPAKERANQLVDFMRMNDKLSVTEFSHRAGPPDARTGYGLRLLGGWTPDWADAHAAINALTSNGLTPIGAGLLEAWNQLSTEPASRPRAIVLLSDGFNNFPPDPATVLSSIPADVPIFSIALGPAANSSALQNIATSRPNGGYFAVEGDEDVHKLHSIYAAVQALASGSSLIGLSSFKVSAEAAQTTKIPVEEGLPEISFVLSWDGRPKETELIITGPDGRRYSNTSTATLERLAQTYWLLRIAAPKPGVWTAVVRNRDKSSSYTLSASAQSPLVVVSRLTPMGRRTLSIVVRLRRAGQPILRAALTARVTAPTMSQEGVLKEYQRRLLEMQLPPALAEKGFTPEQILLVKLAAFAKQYREKPGGLYARNTTEVKLTHRGDGVYSANAKLAATGNITVELTARGKLGRFEWQRAANLSCRI
jgi:serine protease AprX